MNAGSADAPAARDERLHRPFFWVVGGLVVAVLWIRPITSSLWVDEFGTWWTVEGGIRQAIDRAWTFQGQSPFYYVVAWLWRHVAGREEWLLRAPSVLFAALSTYLLFRLLRRLADLETARIAAVVFLAWPIVVFSAVDFRPYALATFLGIAAISLFVRWLDTGNGWTGGAAVVALVAAIYAHYLFGFLVIPETAYAIARVRAGTTRVRPRALVLAAVGTGIAIVPLALTLVDLWDRRDTIGLPGGLSVDWVVTLLAPAAIVGALIAGGGLAAVDGGRIAARLRVDAADLVLLVVWAVGPAAALILLSLVTPIGLQARYSLVWAPGAAALAALAIRAFEPAAARRIVVLTLVVLSMLALGNANHLGDWRGAIETTNAHADGRSLILLQSGYVESLQLDWYDDPERVAYLGAPASFYPVSGQMVVIPVDVAPDPAFTRDRIEASLAGVDRVLLITTSPQLATWVGEVLLDRGFAQDQLRGGTPFVYGYDRHG